MSMGRVNRCSQKCLTRITLSNQLQGATFFTQKCHSALAPASFGASFRAQKCHGINASKGRVQHPDASYVNHMSILPEQFTGGQSCRAEMSPCPRPHHFYLGQFDNAAMPSQGHPRGASRVAQKCHHVPAPHQVLVSGRVRRNAITHAHQGKGQDMFAEMSCNKRLSQPVKGVIVKTQKCQDIVSPRGPVRPRRNAISNAPPQNLGQIHGAEMPPKVRPITRGQHSYAEMPTPIRLAT